MLHPDYVLDLAHLRHEELLREVEAWRLYKQMKGNQPGLLRRVSDRLMAAGQQLKIWLRSNPATPVFSEK